MHDANETLDHRIEHGPLAVGAVGAEPGDRAVDDIGIAGGDGVEVNAQPFDHPGRKFCTTTSLRSAKLSTISTPSGVARSTARQRLPRLQFAYSPRMWSGPVTRVSSPPIGSTLITSAPCSARIWVANGPATTWLRSSTLIPSSGPPIRETIGVVACPAARPVVAALAISADGFPVDLAHG